MLLRQYIVLAVFLFACVPGVAQPCNLILKGTVEDQDNHEALGFAVVKLMVPERIVQANANGEFSFDSLCAGSYQILVQHFGCKDTVFSVSFQKSKRFVFRLPHSLHNLEEIDIMDKRIEMKSTQVTEQLSPEELEQAKGKNLGDVLKTMSGVTTLNTGATISKPMIHGMQGYRLLILNNGIRQEGQQWGNEHAPEIDPFIAKKFSVIKGVNAIRYGSDAIAGVVLVEPDELPDTAAVTGELNLVGFSNGKTGVASGMLEGNFDKLKHFSWRVQGSMKKGGSVRTPDYYLSNTGSQEHNYSYGLGYHQKKWGVEVYYSQFNTTIGIFRGSHIGNLTDLNNAIRLNKPVDSLSGFSYSVERPRQEVSHELIKGLGHYHFSSKWRVKFQYSWQHNSRSEYDLRRLTTAEKQSGVVAPDMDLGITSQSVDALLEHDNVRSFRGMFGLFYMNQANIYNGRFFIPNYKVNSAGAFMTERLVRRYFEVEAGLRYDEKHLQSYFYEGRDWTAHPREFRNFTYNLGLIWKPLKELHVFINGGSAWRAPAPNELYSNGIHQSAGVIEKGNTGFSSETCYNLSSSGIYRSGKISVELSAYYNGFRNFIYLNPSGEIELTIRGAFPVFEYRQDNVRISGIDLKAEYTATKYMSLFIKGMIVRGWNYSTHDYLIYMPSDRADLNLKFKLPDIKRMTNTYLQLNNQLVAKQWRAPGGVDFAPPPPAYYLLGLEASTELNFKKQKVRIGFSATNLLNARYREYLDRFRYYSDAAGVSYNVKLTVPLVLYDKK